ncbi:MAG: ABC transporter substrate-binding protein [Candidatus Aminicenantales bacterium]
MGRSIEVKKGIVFLLLSGVIFFCCQKPEPSLYTIGILQVVESPTVSEVRKGFIQALEDQGLQEGVDVRLTIRNGQGEISEVQNIAQEFVKNKVDMIVALSTPSLQAALIATQRIPIIFSSVANPYLTRAGTSATDHLSNVTGVASTGPIQQTLAFIKEVLPSIRRIGTLWTPSELNSEYYLELTRDAAAQLGFEVIAVPITNTNEILLAAQILINKKIDAIYQISDNTINTSFEAIGKVAEENAIPLFGGFPLSTHLGACAAMGWDFFDMGYKGGLIAVRVKNGESPAGIPFQSMSDIKLYLNLAAAEKQGVRFSEEVLKRANEVIPSKEKIPSHRPSE